ncbi:CLUMA_CG012191, isoform A [Clunio marinus]|uniref:CLUMA_CG012191, isoform A n=1 Tax=Clunio marinus TaxID=568069 RepID=A0A1J1IEU6_9DIPT|nr:CLUMA_CG012191, isoform A [Clunio marinus]
MKSEKNFSDSSKKKCPKSVPVFFPPNFCLFPPSSVNCLNPGSFAAIHKKTRDISPEWFEGLRLRCAKNLDVNKGFYFDWMVGNNTPAGCRFGGMLCRKDYNITKTPLIIVDTNPSTLATNLHFLHHPLPEIRLESKIQTGVVPSRSQKFIGSLEYLGESSTISLAFYNPKCDAGRMTIGFLHSLNNKFCAGFELLTSWRGRKERREFEASLALAARQSFDKSSAAISVSKNALNISGWHQANDSLQLGASMIFNWQTSKALGSLYYQLETKNAIIKGMFDSDWSIGCTYNR